MSWVPPPDWRVLNLSELCEVLRGKRLTKSELSSNGAYPVYHGGIQPLGYYDKSNREGKMVMIVNTGASSGTVGYSVNPFWASDGCYCLKCSAEIDSRYLYYALQVKENRLKSQVRYAGVPTLDMKPIYDLKICVPPLEEQHRIVTILDKFDALVNDLSDGLPAELEARRKQYAYYRDKLLSFEPMN